MRALWSNLLRQAGLRGMVGRLVLASDIKNPGDPKIVGIISNQELCDGKEDHVHKGLEGHSLVFVLKKGDVGGAA